ncbi:unnamed protein product [Phytophthora lilii]|uniref:Unnamed protein product n=1 Tax=Phytophthora lilii TaxID=2077276 RepID=A0A9W6TWC1_9STRA|nr:unnamed protein product [Phytophthora lilii]
MEAVIQHSGRCPPTTSLKSLAYEGENTVQQKLTQHMLQRSDGHSGSLDSSSHTDIKNDGFVESESCSAGIPMSRFAKRPIVCVDPTHANSRLWKAIAKNHFSLSCALKLKSCTVEEVCQRFQFPSSLSI